MILERRFRANPDFELKVTERLEAPEQERLAAMLRGRDAYGVLRPRHADAGGTAKVIDPDVALLLLTLTEPLPFPSYARSLLGDQAERLARQLVLDGVLEMTDDEGRLVTGPAALALCQESRPRSSQQVVRLSEAAVRWASELGFTQEGVLAGMLYWYNSVPSPRRSESNTDWTRRIQSSAALRRTWTFQSKPGEWCMCHPLRRTSAGSDLAYKLYVSVRGEAVVDAAECVFRALTDLGPRPLKFGAHRRALARPDKLIVYSSSLEELRALARALRPELERWPTQGVPFTAPIDDEGRLSWGIDAPPDSEQSEQESWRFRVVMSVATALAGALRAGMHGEAACEYTLTRAALDGIDMETWTPQGSVLMAESRSEV
jgi:hypothetical protein